MLILRLLPLPRFVDVEGVVMPLPRLLGRSLSLRICEPPSIASLLAQKAGGVSALTLSTRREKRVEALFFRLGDEVFPVAGTGRHRVCAFTLPTNPASITTVYRSTRRASNWRTGEAPHRKVEYDHVFRLEDVRGDGCTYWIQADRRLNADELLRCYLAWADARGLVRPADDTDALVLPAVEWLEKETLIDACRREGVKCELVRKNAYSFDHPWAENAKVTIYRIEEGALWGRHWGAVYAHVFPLRTPGGDTAVLLAKSRLGKKAVEKNYTDYDDRTARGLPQSSLPLEYRGWY